MPTLKQINDKRKKIKEELMKRNKKAPIDKRYIPLSNVYDTTNKDTGIVTTHFEQTASQKRLQDEKIRDSQTMTREEWNKKLGK